MSRKASSASRMLMRNQMDNMDIGMNDGGSRLSVVIEHDPETKSDVSTKRFDDDQTIQVQESRHN
jgi:hypothetical protein